MMAFTPFVETDLPTMSGFNAKIQEAMAAAKEGALAEGVKIATGSYVGTGVYGADNPNSLTLGFVPRLLMLSKDGTYATSGLHGIMVCNPDASFGVDEGGSTYSSNTISWGETVSWYYNGTVTGRAAGQLNAAGVKYWYAAIG